MPIHIPVKIESVDLPVEVIIECGHKRTEEVNHGLVSSIYCSNESCYYNLEPLNVITHGYMED